MLNQKTAIITGAARGLGEGIALEFVKQGARCVLTDILDDEGHAVAERINKEGGEAIYLHCDISVSSQVRECVAEATKKFGTVDVLVNNAAISLPPAPITELSDDDFLKVLNVNVAGTFRMCREVFGMFRDNGGGTAINLSSVHQSHSLEGWTAYASSKGAIISMTRQLAAEWGKHNIRVVSLSPGAIDATMTREILDRDKSGELERQFTHMHALERLGRTEEVAKTAAFLASDGAGFITGEDILVDGGLTKLARL